ncbi:MAG: GAF domain-containing protein [Pyrinomonadaceae bacterium]|nr:GAF domain-containing protein [Pyrinomonadaceae bacterium]
MSEKNEHVIEKNLKALVEIVDVVNAMTLPIVKSIENLLVKSAAVMGSEEASVLVRDGDEGDLRFLSATGEVADQLINLRVPAGKGVAGFVFSSGQPMTISDTGQEASFYAEVDKKTGFSTETLLATPIQYQGNIIGVLEYVNRIGRPPYEPFTPEEMDRAALYADPIATLVNAYEAIVIFKDLGDEILSANSEINFEEIRGWLRGVRGNKNHKEMIDLAILIREVSMQGDAERILCKEILESFLSYSENNLQSKFSHL